MFFIYYFFFSLISLIPFSKICFYSNNDFYSFNLRFLSFSINYSSNLFCLNFIYFILFFSSFENSDRTLISEILLSFINELLSLPINLYSILSISFNLFLVSYLSFFILCNSNNWVSSNFPYLFPYFSKNGIFLRGNVPILTIC